jgi:cysteinyl-tRNA synthetase
VTNCLSLYNSLTRKKELLITIDPHLATLYTCGPTVYNYAHIGNLRTYIFNDLLVRTLGYFGYQVKRVMNVTDVGHLAGDGDMGMDKVEKAASEKGMDAWQLSDFYLNAFKSDMERLNMLPPTVWEKATATIPEQIKLIQQIEQKGFSYKISDGVYFDTSKFPEYGAMSSLTNEGIKEAARVDFNAERKNPRDFALWKFSFGSRTLAQNGIAKRRQMEWDSPWGLGFPGWHIECSAIALKHLGNPFDIHTGAIDHKETHHPNEIAQTEVATGKKMANYWLHAGFLNAESDTKMAKSKGNFLTLQTLIDKGYNPLAYRLYTYGFHWRQTVAFSWEALGASGKALQRLQSFCSEYSDYNLYKDYKDHTEENKQTTFAFASPFVERFTTALSDDLNMPKAMAVVWDLINASKKGNFQADAVKHLLDFDRVLALGLNQIWQSSSIVKLPRNISKLIAERNRARAEKNFVLSDKLREQIKKLGYSVFDK